MARDATQPTEAGPSPAASAPLSGQHLRELEQANRRLGAIRRAAGLASFNGWSTAVLAALCLPFAFFGVAALGAGLALSAVAWNEFRGRRLLRALDPRGPRVLGWNQLGLMALVIGYAIWQICAALTGPGRYAQQSQALPELGRTLGSLDNLHRFVALTLYGGLIVGSVIFQGLNALYYFTRRRHVEAYLDETASWIVDVQRRTAA